MERARVSETFQRNEEALRLMQTPCIGSFIAEINSEITQDWADCQDTAAREKLWYDLQALTRLANKIAEGATAAEIDKTKQEE
jgi:hypothetical protein